jgi:hypothetical protein
VSPELSGGERMATVLVAAVVLEGGL